MGQPTHPAGRTGIRIEITLSTLKLDAGRAPDDRFDPGDYADKLIRHLAPILGDVVVETTDRSPDHGIDILVPVKLQQHSDMVDMLARRIIEAVQHFHERAPEQVARRKPGAAVGLSWVFGPFQFGC